MYVNPQLWIAYLLDVIMTSQKKEVRRLIEFGAENKVIPKLIFMWIHYKILLKNWERMGYQFIFLSKWTHELLGE